MVDRYHDSHPKDAPETATIKAELAELSKSLRAQMLVGRLPPPEPSIFFGDPLAYPSWKSVFETFIELHRIQPSEKVYYLQKYLEGVAKEAVEDHFLLV